MKASILALALCGAALAAQAAGPYPAMHETDPSLPGYLVFRPADMSRFGGAQRLPVVGWVNGGCVRANSYISFLEEVASHGYLVVTPGADGERKAARAPVAGRLTVSERFKRIAPPETTTAQLMAGIDWALERGPYAGKVDPGKVALMGHSCGGMQALEGSLDPRVRTTVVLASGYWRLGGDLPGIGLTRATLQALHGPVLYLYGGASDIVQVNAEADFVEISHVPIFKAFRDAGHGLTLRDPQGGDYGHAAIDWLQWQLRGDPAAAATFTGPSCRLCTDPAWTVEKKLIDQEQQRNRNDATN
jgi:dienelactone hydrolase